ncbi:MAG: teichoic acid ABC transporter ATP-binding protein [Actinobacteria bacterium HGW-Actinobacteria-7]|jgi:teichoic acid transport system ATP-binding protein|nr:MAG: teichoic acid ABC transporter ATP-binding protein [Actinobacteria bacterium HGW-Actinobacteria-7]
MKSDQIAIEFRKVSKRYRLYRSDKHRFAGIFSSKIPFKEVYANQNLNFTIRRGESVAVMGKNGAGKSTMLKMITGVVFPSSGEVIVNGRVSALLELTAGFDLEFTGRENVHLRGQIWGLEAAEITDLEAKVVDFADIGDYIDQPMRTYSSGMKARVGFAISAHINPEILVVDEALSVGDKAFRQKCDEKIREIMETDGVTVIFVTHSSGAAESICHRGLVLKKGKLAFDGPISEAIDFYEGPRDPGARDTDVVITDI